MLPTSAAADVEVKAADIPLPPPDKAKLFEYLIAVDHTDWKTFPDGDRCPIRLGLPVHGRWGAIYANDTAYEALVAASKPEAIGDAVELSRGSILLTENRLSKPDGPVGVITVMYKPMDATVCQSGDRFNGSDCFGGDWM